MPSNERPIKCRLNFEKRTEVCGEHGPFESSHSDVGGLLGEWWTACPGCSAQKARQEALKREEEQKRERHERFIQQLLKSAHIPPRFQDKTFDNYQAVTKGQRLALSVARQYAENFKDHETVGRCLSCCGGCGTGKTHLATAIATTIARAGYSVLYTTVTALIRRIRATWGDSSYESEADVLAELSKMRLLILDEVGQSFGGDAEISQLQEILDLRYQRTLPTLVISNYPFTEFSKYLGARGSDRLRDNGGKVVIFDWASHRGQNGN
jgi:DNA replication protein DnaC